MLPVDSRESRRLDLQNHIFNLTLEGRLYSAPLSPDQLHNVLDIGTGTGIWAIAFAKLNPGAKVIGSDISSLERPRSFLRDELPNLSFEISDAEGEWGFGTNFDYIHGRMMMTCFRDVKVVFEKAFTFLEP